MALWICEVLISVVMIAIGVMFYVLSGDFRPSNNPVDIGAAAFPRLMVLLLVLFAVGQIILSAIRTNRSEKLDLGHIPTLLTGIALLMVYIILLPIGGFYLVTPIFILAVMFMQGNRKWVQMISVSAGFCLFTFLIFTTLLKVALP